MDDKLINSVSRLVNKIHQENLDKLDHKLITDFSRKLNKIEKFKVTKTKHGYFQRGRRNK